jgi:uncharacterized protein (DUF302 family)
MTKITMPIVLPFRGHRVRYETRRSFDDVLASLRAAIGVATHNELTQGARDAGTRDDFESLMKRIAGDSDFMLFFELDHGAWLRVFGIERKVLRLTFGNPMIAYTMLKHDVGAGLFAPVEVLLVENETKVGSTLTYDLPSSLMVIEHNPPLLEAARILDRKLAELIERVI